jgi:hypothetical protein
VAAALRSADGIFQCACAEVALSEPAFLMMSDRRHLAIVALAALVLAASAARAQDRVYNDPSQVGARFTHDDKTWRASPPNPNNGILLTCIAQGCRPEPFPMSARCQMAFRVKGNPDGRKDTAAYLSRIDQEFWLRMQAAFMAAPLMVQGGLYQGFQPCATRPQAMCAKVALHRRGETPGLGLLFIEVHGTHLIEGDCHFFDESLPRAPALFENFLSGLALDTAP